MSLQTMANTSVSSLREKKDLIKSTIAKGCSDDQFELFINVCERTGLDPFCKQIYAVMRKSKGVEMMTIQTGIDGLRLIADRTGHYCPGKEPSFTYDSEGKLISATSYCKKMTRDGTWHEFSATAHYDEYVPTYESEFWKTKEHIMLAKCAEALALRKGWPADMSNLYIKEEMDKSPILEADAEVVQSKKVSKQPAPVAPEDNRTEAELLKECNDKFGANEDLDFPVSAFLKYCVEKYNASLSKTAKDALKNSDKFAQAYRKWAEAKLDELIASTKKPDTVDV